ncbi:MAG: LysR substrate-binding domain-containing protein [Aquisalimonadaceae bacterium]
MQLKSLRLFATAARTGSFVAAAEEACTVQSNVTAHVKKLEDELGLSLFVRHGGIHLTPSGRLLLTYAQRMLDLHDEAIQGLRFGDAPAGLLRIGSLETTAAVRLPAVLAGFHAAFPDVNLNLCTGTTAELIQRVSTGLVDGAFVAGDVPAAGLERIEVFRERLVLVSAQPLTALPPPDVLLRTAFLGFRQGCTYRQRIELYLAEYGVPPVRIFEFGTLDAILGCVVAGMGFTVLPEAVVASQQSRFRVYGLPLPTDIATVPTFFIAPERSGWTPALKEFARYVLEHTVDERTPEREAI